MESNNTKPSEIDVVKCKELRQAALEIEGRQ